MVSFFGPHLDKHRGENLSIHVSVFYNVMYFYYSGAMLRQSQSRINIHRSKKLTAIAKKKDDICRHLESGNEVNAKIWAETLLNEEGQIPVYDVVSTMCDQVNGRLTQIAKFG